MGRFGGLIKPKFFKLPWPVDALPTAEEELLLLLEDNSLPIVTLFVLR